MTNQPEHHTGDLIELIGAFPHENFDYQTTNTNNQFEDPIIIYTENSRPKPHYNRPKPDYNRPEDNRPKPDYHTENNRPESGQNRPKPEWEEQDFNQNNYFHVKPSYHETTAKPDGFYPDYPGQNNADSGDDYVPVSMHGHKPLRPSYPGEILIL